MERATQPATWTMVPVRPGSSIPVTIVATMASSRAIETQLILPKGVGN